MFGFSNLLMLNLIEYSIKLHNCQTENIMIKNCQDLLDDIDTRDQKSDLQLGVVSVDRNSDMFNAYDNQLEAYNKLLHQQEIKQLEPLNEMANLDLQASTKRKRNINITQQTADDFVGIINDLTNINLSNPNLEGTGVGVEDFDNQIKENLDLSEGTFRQYQERIQRQLRGLTSQKNLNMLDNARNTIIQIFNIMTKDGRIMSSGMILIVIALALYFIDITS
jgi:hypothetical protein